MTVIVITGIMVLIHDKEKSGDVMYLFMVMIGILMAGFPMCVLKRGIRAFYGLMIFTVLFTGFSFALFYLFSLFFPMQYPEGKGIYLPGIFFLASVMLYYVKRNEKCRYSEDDTESE